MKVVNLLNKILIVIILIVVICFVVGISYSYFTSGFSGSEIDTTVTVEAGDMKVVYDGGPNIEALNIEPSELPFATKTFTITGTSTFSNREMWYEISLIVDENTFSTDALSYTLEGVNNASNGSIITDILTRQAINNTNIKLGRGKFSGLVTGGVHTYTLKVYFYETWLDQSIDLRKKFKAHIEIEDYIPLPLNGHIIGLADDSANTGVYYENGYRYEGLDPNNYVIFNNELWRIIGVFDSNTHGKTGENLVKIIRNDPLGDQTYWGYGNNWKTASLKGPFNTYYNGMTQVNKDLVESIIWKLGGIASMSNVGAAYAAERATTVTDEGYIALMYPSDYGYAVLSSSCPRTIGLGNYNTPGCYDQNWMYKGPNEFTLTHSSSNSYAVWYITGGTLYFCAADTKYKIFRPTLYLKSNTPLMSGEGTSTNPYIIVE